LRTQPSGQYALQLRQRAQRRVVDPRSAGRRGGERDRRGQRLVVVEQQRREVAARRQPVAARGAGGRLDRVVERAQPVDVAAQRPVGHPQPLGQPQRLIRTMERYSVRR
jgi:hypothetical protein